LSFFWRIDEGGCFSFSVKKNSIKVFNDAIVI